MARDFDPLSNEAAAADYAIAALGRDDAKLLLLTLRAGWLTPDEAARLEPFASAIATLLGEPLPTHRKAVA